MTDFSHLFIVTPETVAREIDAGRRPTDEQFLKALRNIAPPLFPSEIMEVVLRTLDPKERRRGRPRKNAVTPREAAAFLATVDRAELPASFIKALAKRLGSSRPHTDFERQKAAHRIVERRKRDMVIRIPMPDLQELLKRGPPYEHPLLGRLPGPDEGTPADQVLGMLRKFLIEKGFYPPSISTMRNIRSKKLHRKRPKHRRLVHFSPHI